MIALILAAALTVCPTHPAGRTVIGYGNNAATPLKISNTYKAFESAKTELTGFRMANAWMNVERMGFYVKNGDCDVIVKNTTINGTKEQTGDSFPAGFQVDAGGDTLLEDVTIRNFYMKPVDGVYNNGDGVVYNNGSYNNILRRVKIVGASDAGVDSKSVGLLLDRVTVEDVDLCFKLWRDATATNLTCRRAERGAIQLLWGASLTVDILRIEGGSKTIGMSANSSLTVNRCIYPIGKIFYRDGGSPTNTTLKLGPGC